VIASAHKKKIGAGSRDPIYRVLEFWSSGVPKYQRFVLGGVGVPLVILLKVMIVFYLHYPAIPIISQVQVQRPRGLLFAFSLYLLPFFALKENSAYLKQS